MHRDTEDLELQEGVRPTIEIAHQRGTRVQWTAVLQHGCHSWRRSAALGIAAATATTLLLVLLPGLIRAQKRSDWRPSTVNHVQIAAQNDSSALRRIRLAHRGRHYVVVDAARQQLGHGGAACNALLDLPRVTLLFLSRAGLPHERLWASWLGSVRGLLPLSHLREAACDAGFAAEVHDACMPDDGASPVWGQHLFNVITHPRVDFAGFSADSIFNGTELDHRQETAWGSYKTTEAVKRMLRHGLEDPFAQQFLLLSETDVPLYPAKLVWLQLTGETKSRINACAHGAGKGRPPDTWEWQPAIGAEAPGVTLQMWRKSPQFFGLRRRHAVDVVSDATVWPAFARHCRSYADQSGQWQQCYVDEHYMPTLLAALGKDAETDCVGHLTEADWTRPGSHGRSGPYECLPEDVSFALMQRLRTEVDWGLKQDPAACRADAAVSLAERGFTTAAALTAGEVPCQHSVEGASAAQVMVLDDLSIGHPAARPAGIAAEPADAASVQAADSDDGAQTRQGDRDETFAWDATLLAYECPVFARKFPANTSAQVQAVLSQL